MSKSKRRTKVKKLLVILNIVALLFLTACDNTVKTLPVNNSFHSGTLTLLPGFFPNGLHYYHDSDRGVGIWVLREAGHAAVSIFVLPDTLYNSK